MTLESDGPTLQRAPVFTSFAKTPAIPGLNIPVPVFSSIAIAGMAATGLTYLTTDGVLPTAFMTGFLFTLIGVLSYFFRQDPQWLTVMFRAVAHQDYYPAKVLQDSPVRERTLARSLGERRKFKSVVKPPWMP